MKYIQKINGNWPELKEMLKSRYQNLLPEDIEFENGEYDAMIWNLCIKLNKTHQELIWLLNSLHKN
jgi:hypothetical protein